MCEYERVIVPLKVFWKNEKRSLFHLESFFPNHRLVSEANLSMYFAWFYMYNRHDIMNWWLIWIVWLTGERIASRRKMSLEWQHLPLLLLLLILLPLQRHLHIPLMTEEREFYLVSYIYTSYLYYMMTVLWWLRWYPIQDVVRGTEADNGRTK